MPTVFIALQCCECSTMQVKQQKKSSNKWSCVVCNLKQSVRKVYAQGFMAKEVRKFVQNFNMSRQLAEQNLPITDEPNEALGIGDKVVCNGKQKRTDWTEYIDPEENSSNAPYSLGENKGDQIEIITELPKPLFKKPKLKSYRPRKDCADDEEETSLAKFGGRHTRTNITSHDAGSSRCCDAMVRGAQQKKIDYAAESKPKFADELEGMKLAQPMNRMSEWQSCSSHAVEKKFANELPRRSQSSTAQRQSASKWSCYITEDEEEEGSDLVLLGRRKDLTQAAELNHHQAYETEFLNQRVEEDIHPDFL